MNDYLVTWRFGRMDDPNQLAVKACSEGEAMQKAYAQLGSHPLMGLTARRADPIEVRDLRSVGGATCTAN